jgi:copper chaperone CopZ
VKTEKIVIANLKYSGCENTIKSEISRMEGLQNVVVNQNEDNVWIQYQGTAN